MKIHNQTINNELVKQHQSERHQYSPSFKAGGALNIIGSFMQGIENGGFLASFLVQDTIGMTIPRTGAAFLRDKEVTGHYNFHEAKEVFGREGLTGPIMMSVAPLMMLLAAKCGRTTSVNTRLIKRFGNSLKELISKPNFDKNLIKNKDAFKTEFYKTNIEQILEQTLGKENVKEDSVKYILEQIANYEKIPANAKLKKFNGKSKYRKECISNIREHINDIAYKTKSDLEILDKVRYGSEKLDSIKTFSTKDTIEAMIKYSDDAITYNKHLDTLDEIAAENLKDSSIAKRLITNVATIAATLGVMSVLPKIYARSSISPGARTAMELKENQKAEEAKNTAAQQGEVSFKGKGGKPSSWLAKLGKFIQKHYNEKFASELEYNGHNFTNTLMAGLSLFGLLAPRGLHAYRRAQVDENGKKDLTELWEILIRDVSSSLSVVFAVPMLTRAFVTSYEKNSGFVLMHKDRTRTGIKTFFDLINPYTSTHVLSNQEIASLYNNVNTHEKMLNFCTYIDNNGGDLEKILSKSEGHAAIFNESTVKLSDLTNLSRAEKNSKIKETIKNLGKDGKLNKADIDKKIAELMKSGAKPKNNKILSAARGLNSIPGFIATVIISPVILGWIIPRLTYANTRRIHAKQELERQEKAKINTAA